MKTDALRPSRLFAGWLRRLTVGVCLGLALTWGLLPSVSATQTASAQSSGGGATPPPDAAPYVAYVRGVYQTAFGHLPTDDEIGFRLVQDLPKPGNAMGITPLGESFTFEATSIISTPIDTQQLNAEELAWVNAAGYEVSVATGWIHGSTGSVGCSVILHRYWHNQEAIVEIMPVCDVDPALLIPDLFVGNMALFTGDPSSPQTLVPSLPDGNWTDPQQLFVDPAAYVPCFDCCAAHDQRMENALDELSEAIRNAREARDEAIEQAWSSYNAAVAYAHATRLAAYSTAAGAATFALANCVRASILLIHPWFTLGRFIACAAVVAIGFGVVAFGIEAAYAAQAQAARAARGIAIAAARADFQALVDEAMANWLEEFNDSNQLLRECLEAFGCPEHFCGGSGLQ